MKNKSNELRDYYVRDLQTFALWSLGLTGIGLVAFSDWYYQLDLISTVVQKVTMLFV